MSLDLYIVLSGGLPDLAALGERLADQGGVRGSWKRGVRLGGVAVAVADSAAPRASALLAKAKKKIKVDKVLEVTEGDFEEVEDVAEILLAHGGGALVSESGAVLLSRSGPKKKAEPPKKVEPKKKTEAKKAEPPKKAAPRARGLDTSIPREVLELLGETQALYEVHPRVPPKSSLRAIMKSVPAPSSEVEFLMSATAKIGNVLLSRASVVFRTSFDPWFFKEAEPADWTAALHLACGLARHTRGVLLRRLDNEYDLRFDFEPSEPLPATVPLAVLPCEHYSAVSYKQLECGRGDMVGMGRKVVLRWHIPGVTQPAETTVVLGAPKANPALACFHGEQVGTTLRIELGEPRGLSSRVPPCPDGPSATLEITLLKVRDQKLG